MQRDAWLPLGFELPGGVRATRPLFTGTDWQICEFGKHHRSLIARELLAQRWITAGLLTEAQLPSFDFGPDRFRCLDGGHLRLEPLEHARAPDSARDAKRCAVSFRQTRAIDPRVELHDALYAALYLRLLPTYSSIDPVADDQVFAAWLTGGVPVPLSAVGRLRALSPWVTRTNMIELLDIAQLNTSPTFPVTQEDDDDATQPPFRLTGRPELAQFFIDHVIDIVQNEERYKALGVGFPAAIALHGPPGCGKTFAVEQLIAHLRWPSFSIDASSIASPYVHDTSKKIAELFDQAAATAPAIIVIDEMDAFLSERQRGASSQHRVEEVAEFLRRLTAAPKRKVLVIGMTNRIDAIDPAVLRRGRFDHIIKVDMASEAEVESLLNHLLASIPHDSDIDVAGLARTFAGRPLSDVSYLVREAARRSAKNKQKSLTSESVCEVMDSIDSEGLDRKESSKKMGFLRL